MLKDENPENNPDDSLKKLLNELKSGDNGKIKPKKTASKKSSAKKPVKRAAKKKVTAKKPKQSSDLLKIMQLIEEDPELKLYRKNIKTVVSKIYEHLNCFILIGYTENGEPVQVTTAKSPKDYDALSTALQKYVFDTMPKPPPG